MKDQKILVYIKMPYLIINNCSDYYYSNIQNKIINDYDNSHVV